MEPESGGKGNKKEIPRMGCNWSDVSKCKRIEVIRSESIKTG